MTTAPKDDMINAIIQGHRIPDDDQTREWLAQQNDTYLTSLRMRVSKPGVIAELDRPDEALPNT